MLSSAAMASGSFESFVVQLFSQSSFHWKHSGLTSTFISLTIIGLMQGFIYTVGQGGDLPRHGGYPPLPST
jgi:uncharacterized membrane protein